MTGQAVQEPNVRAEAYDLAVDEKTVLMVSILLKILHKCCGITTLQQIIRKETLKPPI